MSMSDQSTAQGVSMASPVLGAVGGILEGQARAAELKQQARIATIQGAQDQTARLTDLQRTLGAISALQSQRSVNPDSPSGQAYEQGVRKEAYRGIDTARQNAQISAAALRSSASGALTQGWVDAGSTLFDSFFKAAMAGAGG